MVYPAENHQLASTCLSYGSTNVEMCWTCAMERKSQDLCLVDHFCSTMLRLHRGCVLRPSHRLSAWPEFCSNHLTPTTNPCKWLGRFSLSFKKKPPKTSELPQPELRYKWKHLPQLGWGHQPRESEKIGWFGEICSILTVWKRYALLKGMQDGWLHPF